MALTAASSSKLLAQGTVTFLNRSASAGIDARVLLADGTGVGAGFTAQLYGGPASAQVGSLTPLFPTTTFRTLSAAAMGYVESVVVTVPGVPPLNDAKLIMRVFSGVSWETSLCRGESNPLQITLGGGDIPPTGLSGLQPLTLPCIPEPRVATICLVGLTLALLQSVRIWSSQSGRGTEPNRPV